MSTHNESRVILTRNNLIHLINYDSVRRSYLRYAQEILQASTFEIRPHAGMSLPQKSKKGSSAGSAQGTVTAAPVGGEGGAGGDDDGDGDGDGDGPPRKLSLPHRLPPSRPPSRTRRRLNIPAPLTRRAFTWLLTLALLLAYLGPPCFAALFIYLGEPELARDMLQYQPKLLMPLPLGWSM